MIYHTDTQGFDNLIKKLSGIVLVDFFATWCGPCRMLSASLEKLDKEAGDKVTIVKIDIDNSPDLAQKFEVESVPTMVIYKDGEIVNQVVGARSVDELNRMLFG